MLEHGHLTESWFHAPIEFKFLVGAGAALWPDLGLVGEHNAEPAAGTFLAPSQAFVRF